MSTKRSKSSGKETSDSTPFVISQLRDNSAAISPNEDTSTPHPMGNPSIDCQAMGILVKGDTFGAEQEPDRQCRNLT